MGLRHRSGALSTPWMVIVVSALDGHVGADLPLFLFKQITRHIHTHNPTGHILGTERQRIMQKSLKATYILLELMIPS